MKQGSLWAVLSMLVAGIAIIAVLSLLNVQTKNTGAQITGNLVVNANDGIREYKISIMNSDTSPRFCQGTLNVTKSGKLLKRIRQNAGTLAPGEERTIAIRVKIPYGAAVSIYPVCV